MYHLAVRMKLPEFDIIHEGHVVRGMPVQTVAMEVKRDRINQAVDGLHDLKYIMFSLNAKLFRFTSSPFCWAGQFVMEREPDMKSFCTSTMIIAVRGLTIYFHRNLCFHLLILSTKPICHLFNPAIPAEHKLLLAHAAVSGDIEDHEEVTDELSVHPDHTLLMTNLNTPHTL